jgi:hypothetical protein
MEKQAFPYSTCVECGKKMPSGMAQRCSYGGWCNWHIPNAVAATLDRLFESIDPETLEAIADEIDCFDQSARAHSLRVIARNQRKAIEK